jgi:DNA-binding NarL/FixJ family response regulator
MVPGMAARVLLGNLEPVVALGMKVVLEERGLEAIGSEPRVQPLLLLAGQLHPDAVVLDLHQADSRTVAERLRAAAPDTTVVLWARDEEVMEVGARRIESPTPQDLSDALERRSIAAP